MVVNDVFDLIGNTPLIKFQDEPIVAKAEFLNPGGSIKDRIALKMIEAAEKNGDLKPDMKIIECTSGNTGIGITMVGVAKGYEVIIVMPEGMSEERKDIIRMMGGRLILTPESESIAGALKKAIELSKDKNVFMPNQFENINNIKAHYEFTAPELWRQTKGDVDIFVSGIGSGGTIQGVGTYLKMLNPNIKVVAVEPANKSVLLGQEPGLHQIQGIGDGFIPGVLDIAIIDDIVEVTDANAIGTAQELARNNSLLVGTSSGANMWAAREVVKRYPGKKVATVLPDRGERYFSTKLFQAYDTNAASLKSA